MRRLAKWSKWKPGPWPPPAEASALLTPNHTMSMVANARNMLFPMLSNVPACSVMSCVRNAKRSFMELGVIGFSSLWHAPGQHGRACARSLRSHYRFAFGHEPDVVVDSLRFGIAFPFGVHDLLFSQGNQQI